MEYLAVSFIILFFLIQCVGMALTGFVWRPKNKPQWIVDYISLPFAIIGIIAAAFHNLGV